MTWTRLDDNWMADEAFDDLDVPTMWHYLNMIQFCSRGKRYTGLMPLAHARTCSIVEDPIGAIAALMQAGLVENVDGATVRIVRIDEHVPPPSVREAAAATKVRVARHRKHKNGDHSECLPDKCDQVGNGRGNALHQDGTETGRAVTGSATRPTRSGPWPRWRPSLRRLSRHSWRYGRPLQMRPRPDAERPASRDSRRAERGQLRRAAAPPMSPKLRAGSCNQPGLDPAAGISLTGSRPGQQSG